MSGLRIAVKNQGKLLIGTIFVLGLLALLFSGRFNRIRTNYSTLHRRVSTLEHEVNMLKTQQLNVLQQIVPEKPPEDLSGEELLRWPDA